MVVAALKQCPTFTEEPITLRTESGDKEVLLHWPDRKITGSD